MHEHHIWAVHRVRVLAADHRDEVFVLDVDLDTLYRRLDQRPHDEWGSHPSERELIVRLHQSKEDIPRTGVVIDATPPLTQVVDAILRHTGGRDTPRLR